MQWKRSEIKINCKTIATVYCKFAGVTRTQRRTTRKLE
jgi:hypothetical protein